MQMWFCTKAININCRETGYIAIKETLQFRLFTILTLNFEQAVILDNFIVEFSEHVSVVVDKFEELSSYSPEIILANGQTGWNLKREKYIFCWKFRFLRFGSYKHNSLHILPPKNTWTEVNKLQESTRFN